MLVRTSWGAACCWEAASGGRAQANAGPTAERASVREWGERARGGRGAHVISAPSVGTLSAGSPTISALVVRGGFSSSSASCMCEKRLMLCSIAWRSLVALVTLAVGT